jgi:3-polyprenyl-4-hydroxybenzoate decarboxylase
MFRSVAAFISLFLYSTKKTMLAACSHDTSSNVASSLMSDLKKHDAQEARDERRHLYVDVDYGKALVRSNAARMLVE